MTKNSLDLSGKIDTAMIELYEVVNQIANKLDIPYMVVGATARDLVLHYGCDAPIRRATADVDFGMQVEGWERFEELKNELINNGFKATRSAHRLIDSKNTPVDIVPFGALEDKDSRIQWPPKGDIEMSVLGFQEAYDHAVNVVIQHDTFIEIPVATSQGLALLKLVAWSDRVRNLRTKDAKDLAYLFETYEKVGEVLNRIYDENGIIDQYDWQVTLASAHILGVDSAAISQDATKEQIHNILEKNLNTSTPNILVEEMCERIDDEYDEKLSLLQAFANGFRQK